MAAPNRDATAKPDLGGVIIGQWRLFFPWSRHFEGSHDGSFYVISSFGLEFELSGQPKEKKELAEKQTPLGNESVRGSLGSGRAPRDKSRKRERAHHQDFFRRASSWLERPKGDSHRVHQGDCCMR
jgi:hypothetical protein